MVAQHEGQPEVLIGRVSLPCKRVARERSSENLSRRLTAMYDRLLAAYGPQSWWPGETPWEVSVGAVLTQNTNWGNVERAIANLKGAGVLDPVAIAGLPPPELAELIRPSGYYRLKAGRLQAVTAWWLAHVRSDRLHPGGRPLAAWRESLLAVRGVGPETADSILLYAFGLPTFVIDAYTRRIMARHFGTAPNIDYHVLQALFLENLPADARLFNEFHALFVRNAKEGCRKATCLPTCPLR
jgi:endonuclease-3 related protein